MEWNVKNALSRDVEREQLNKILKEIRLKLDAVTAPVVTPPRPPTPSPPSRFPVTVTLTGDVEGTATGTGSLTISTTLTSESSGIGEAPNDGSVYWRGNEQWQQVPQAVQFFSDINGAGILAIDEDGVLYPRTVITDVDDIVIENADGVAGDPLLYLADVPDVAGGVLQKTSFDSKGRKIGTSEATTDDLVEGEDNLYFSTERTYDSLKGILEAGANVILTEDDLSQTITITATGGGGGGTGSVDTVNSGTGIQVNNTDPSNPIINLQPAVATRIANAVVPSVTATDGDILEYEATTSNWVPKKNPRELYLDGGNF